MKLIAVLWIFPLVLSYSTAGFLTNLVTGSGRKNRQELTTTTERETFKPMTQDTQFYLEDNSNKKPSRTTTGRTITRTTTQEAQLYFGDSAKIRSSAESTTAQNFHLEDSDKPFGTPAGSENSMTVHLEENVGKVEGAAFVRMVETSDGGFEFTCDKNMICMLSRQRNQSKLICNNRECEKLTDESNFECKISSGPTKLIGVYANLKSKRASCEAKKRTIFNPQTRKNCPDGQKADISGQCRLDFG